MSEAKKPSEAENKSSFKKEKIVWLINSVIKKVESSHGGLSGETIYAELKDLKRIIEETRNEIGMSRADDINAKDIPVATDELDAVVEATSEASGKIMDSCDVIQEQAGSIGGAHGEAIIAEVTKIYEACSFQDITGQRIKKVIKTLKSIEERVEKLVAALGSGTAGDKMEAATGDAALLNGPQLPGNAISQEEIDKLLKEFD